MEEKKIRCLHEDEIDLKELFKIVWQKRIFIINFTFLITLISMVYVYVYVKKPIPIYKGSLLVEIAQIKTENNIVPFDNVYNIKIILENSNNVTILIPNNTNRIIRINSKSPKKEKIKENIEKTYEKLLEIENKKLKFFKYNIFSKRLGDIRIEPSQINEPKKKLIVVVSFITSFILSIFLVFFFNFIKNIKEENNND